MKHPPILIKGIRQKDNYTFTIDWTDGTTVDYRLSKLQAKCPCAKCYDPATGKQHVEESKQDPQVRAVKISSAGRYALRVQFTSGCSKGIYSYAFLKDLLKDVEHA